MALFVSTSPSSSLLAVRPFTFKGIRRITFGLALVNISNREASPILEKTPASLWILFTAYQSEIYSVLASSILSKE